MTLYKCDIKGVFNEHCLKLASMSGHDLGMQDACSVFILRVSRVVFYFCMHELYFVGAS